MAYTTEDIQAHIASETLRFTLWGSRGGDPLWIGRWPGLRIRSYGLRIRERVYAKRMTREEWKAIGRRVRR